MLDEELHTSYLKQLHLPKDMDNLFESDAKEFQKVMMMYSCAIKEVKTKLQVLNDEFSMTKNRNPIEFVKTRIKQPDSIATKLKKKGYPITVESVRQHLNDVAGVRVICSFIDDIYKVADMLSAQDDVVLIKTKDYIKKPKMNGYRSLHLIVEVPVFFSDHKYACRSPDSYDCDGLLGKLRASGKIQKKYQRCRKYCLRIACLCGCNKSDGFSYAGNPRQYSRNRLKRR